REMGSEEPTRPTEGAHGGGVRRFLYFNSSVFLNARRAFAIAASASFAVGKYAMLGPPSALRTGHPSNSRIMPWTSRGKLGWSPRFRLYRSAYSTTRLVCVLMGYCPRARATRRRPHPYPSIRAWWR